VFYVAIYFNIYYLHIVDYPVEKFMEKAGRKIINLLLQFVSVKEMRDIM